MIITRKQLEKIEADIPELDNLAETIRTLRSYH
jgi:hypothetical protein